MTAVHSHTVRWSGYGGAWAGDCKELAASATATDAAVEPGFISNPRHAEGAGGRRTDRGARTRHRKTAPRPALPVRPLLELVRRHRFGGAFQHEHLLLRLRLEPRWSFTTGQRIDEGERVALLLHQPGRGHLLRSGAAL